MKNISVKAVVHSLMDLIDEGTIHLNDSIIFSKLLDDSPKGYASGYPEGTLNLVIRSTDPKADNDTDIYIFTKEMKEENQNG